MIPLLALYLPLIAAIEHKDNTRENLLSARNERIYIQKDQWSMEEEFLMAVFQVIESLKAKNDIEVADNNFVHSEYSPISWSKMTTCQNTRAIIKLMFPTLIIANFSKIRHMEELNAQELFANATHTIHTENTSHKQILEQYSKHFKYFVFVKNYSQEALIDLSRKIGFKNNDESNFPQDINIKNATTFCRKTESYTKNLLHVDPINTESVFTPNAEILFKSKRFLAMDYLCINAFGVDYSSEYSQGLTLFMLKNGIQTVIAPNTENVFIIGSGIKTIYGGTNDDIFVLYGNSIIGDIHGLGGYNILDFSLLETDDSVRPTTVSISHYNQKQVVYWSEMSNINLYNINGIIGREGKTDSISVDCTMKKIQLQGGGIFLSDHINIMSNYGHQCQYNLNIVLAGNTTINEGAVDGKITYFVDDRFDSETSIHLHCSATNDIFVEETLLINTTLNYNFYIPNIELDAISEENKSIKLKIHASNAPCHLDTTTLYFADGFIKFTYENEMILFINTEMKIAQTIDNWKNKLSNQHSIIYFKINDELLLFNGDKVEFYDEYYFVRSLNLFHNLYRKTSFCPQNSQVNYFNMGSINRNNEKPDIGEINIYCLDNTVHNVIYLTNFTKLIHGKGYNELYIEVTNEGTNTQDITLIVNLEDGTGRIQEAGKITIVNGKMSNISQTVTLQIYGNLKLSKLNNTFDLQAENRMINMQEIMIIDPNNFDRGTKFVFQGHSVHGQLKAFYVDYSNHMIIANIDPINYFIVVLINYNLYKQKFDTATFEFFRDSNASTVVVNLIDIVQDPDHMAMMYELFDESFEMVNHVTTFKPQL